MKGDEPGSEPGVYCLVLRLDQGRRITVGKLGAGWLPAGWYLYLGSALGPGGLKARLARHLRAGRRHRWHVDDLLDHARVTKVWWAEWPQRLECEWAGVVRGWPGARVPVPRFGASDCRCPAHLVWLADEPDLAAITQALANVRPGLVVRELEVGDNPCPRPQWQPG